MGYFTKSFSQGLFVYKEFIGIEYIEIFSQMSSTKDYERGEVWRT